MSADLGSRSDLEALRRSGRGKFVVVALLLVAALGAAAWAFLFRKKGVGNAEDPAKVFVVGTTRGHSIGLTDAGFDAAEGSFEAWVAKAEDEVPDLEVDGIEAIMQLADRFGYGYVVFEHPQDVDFSPLEIEGGTPTIPEHARFAVLSVGDFAFPHEITFNPEPSEVMQGDSIVLLQALFEQKILAATLEAEQSASMDVIKLRDRLQDAVEKLERVPQAELMADKIVAEVRRQLHDAERAEPKPFALARPLESVAPVPLANGEVLGISRGFRVVTRDAVRADLDLEDEERFVVGAVDGEPEARTDCTALATGTISVHESPRYWLSDAGDAMLLQTLSDGYALWTLGEGEGCAFSRAGAIDPPGPGISNEASPHRSGKVARAGSVGGQGVVVVSSAGGGPQQMLGMLDDVELHDPTWIDARYLVAIAQRGTGIDDVVLFDLERPMTVLTIPASVFDGAEALTEVAVAARGDHPRLVVTAGAFPRRVYRLDLPLSLDAMFDEPPQSPDALPVEPRDGMPTPIALDTNVVATTALTHEGRAAGITVSPDGTRVALALADGGLDERNPGDSEIVLVPVDGDGARGMRLLTRNALRDYEPRFTADGSHLVFKTRVEIPKTQWRITAPRAVKL